MKRQNLNLRVGMWYIQKGCKSTSECSELRRTEFDPTAGIVGFIVHKVALGQVFF